MARNSTRPLGSELTVKELNRLIDYTNSLGNKLDEAREENARLLEAFKNLQACNKDDVDIAKEIYDLCQNSNWLKFLLEAGTDDAKYMVSHLRAIISIKQMRALERGKKKDGIPTT